jgi:hypothetical protein
MMIAKAPPAQPLTLLDQSAHMFLDATPNLPNPTACMLTLPNTASLELQLLNITATGLVKANQDCIFTVSLYAYVNNPKASGPPAPDPHALWTIMAQSYGEAIGGTDDFIETQWMLQANNLMFNFSSGKMQGTYQSNIADDPIDPQNLSNAIVGLEPLSPIMWLAICPSFVPTPPPLDDAKKPKAEAQAMDVDDGVHPYVQLVTFSLTGDF